jgi:hypothetical protein
VGTKLLVTFGAAVTVLGMALAFGATRFPVYRNTLERWGGGCFVTGLVLLAFFFYPIT